MRTSRSEKTSQLPAIVPEEFVTRFIYSSRHFSISKGKAKFPAFSPQLVKGKWETSVFRIQGLGESEIENLAAAFPRSERLKARADLDVQTVIGNGLVVEPTPKHHPRHADIVEWPAEESEQKLIAIELAASAKLKLYEKSGGMS